MAKILDWAMKILSVLVIPVVIWGATLQTKVAVQASEILRLQEDVKAALALKDMIGTNAQAMAHLEEKLNAAVGNLQEIKGLLHDAQ